jgi:protocatechuate 3,4-dioxygenase, beta subunit
MPVSSESQVVYLPYEDRTQTAREIPGYPRSLTRTPLQPLIQRPLTLSELTGPTGLERKLKVGDNDLSRAVAGGPRALGQLIQICGRVLDEDGSPVVGAVVEVWQANAAGKYIHEYDQTDSPIDPNFTGTGRMLSDQDGRFEFLSIKPGAYPVPESDWWWRPPHIHFSIFGPNWMSRLVTQMFFPGDPLNQSDLLFTSVRDEEARQRLIAQLLPTKIGANNFLQFSHALVLRGRRCTPPLD